MKITIKRIITTTEFCNKKYHDGKIYIEPNRHIVWAKGTPHLTAFFVEELSISWLVAIGDKNNKNIPQTTI